jgi:pimeloyl-ACP methyl ester carboxylesterase
MQRAIEMVSNGLTLRGMLHMPERGAGNAPLVMFFHGFTGNKMEPHFMFVRTSRLLEEIGIASVRFDFAHSGESDGDFINMTLSGEISDACNILDYVLNLDGIDPGRIGAIGLSMGGAVASALAGMRKDDIKALCLWAPAGNMGELVMANNAGIGLDSVKSAGYFDRGGFRVGKGFIEDVVKLDIFKIASAYDKKVLIIHGDNDASVPLSTSERYLKYYAGRAKLHVVKGADHTFNSVPWEKELIDHTLEFFKENL